MGALSIFVGMPNRQKHRGQHSNDPKIFNEKWIPSLNEAVDDLSFLLSRGYTDNPAIKIVGDKFKLTKRQRMAVWRAACKNEALIQRKTTRIAPSQLKNKEICVDGYNMLINIESALGGGIIIECRDGAYRDIASIHGTYRKVEETIPALKLLGASMKELEVSHAHWYLDTPVSNSGLLKELMYQIANEQQFPWDIELANNPDKEIIKHTDKVTISSDGWVLDHATNWCGLNKFIIDQQTAPNIIQLKGHQQI